MRTYFPGILFVFSLLIVQWANMVAYKGGTYEAYKNGQIDAARGIQHFHLTTQPSGETLWVETKEGK